MNMLHPGVEFAESMALPPISEDETAVPVFVGYTENGSMKKLIFIESMSEFVNLLGGADHSAGNSSVLYYAVQHYFDNGGHPCFVYSVDTYKALATCDSATILAELCAAVLSPSITQEPAVSLLSVPDIVLLDADASTENWLLVWQAMLSACVSKTGLFSLLDSPVSVAAAKSCLDVVDLVGSENGAAYWPRLVSDYTLENSRQIVLPPSAAVAAIIQRTDRERGVWKAPANVALAHVIQPAISHLQADGLFNHGAASINLIRSFPGRGVRVWGCRTLTPAPSSHRRYVQVRRLLSYIEARLARVGRFSVFEPNNEITWLKLKSRARDWLRKLWLSGGLFGVVESEAFELFVGLDESMTAEDIKAGRLIMKVRVAALYPAEFIEIHLHFELQERHGAGNSQGILI
ncbi:phage tail sheath C-terminal domain-containing protein [Pseudomonas sp. NFIX28]|uniref:phage tail sheath family protein n=1 Tax=Pseudomonas sp. NFIX28 TaxID=1566235 RepID=UPI0008993D09|nr:phage tail sheath C-terminal domain-containing protein [Pseudomonas sp. NFIX28]SDY37839.1 Phage tail sheath protein FI [Pseudomonas sp. NFIX28]